MATKERAMARMDEVGAGAHVAWVVELRWQPEKGSGSPKIVRAGVLAGMIEGGGSLSEGDRESAEMAIGRLCQELSPGARGTARPSRSLGFDEEERAPEARGSRHSFFALSMRHPVTEAEARAALARVLERAREELRSLTGQEPMSLDEASCAQLSDDSEAGLIQSARRVMAEAQRQELDVSTRLAERRQGAETSKGAGAGPKGL